jgi:hypothetical protein
MSGTDMHEDLDTKPSKNPFDRFPVVAYRVETNTHTEERFFVLEVDLPTDNLGPLAAPKPVTEAQARIRLGELGLTRADVEARIAWARRWMATHIKSSDNSSVMWLPPL